MKYLLGLSLVLFAAVAPAQIPMSNFVRTSTSSLTHGFYFQAPVDFTVTAVQVPDEAGKGRYHVALYRMTAPPPAFSQRVNVNPVFYRESVPAATRASTGAAGIAYKKGEWFAILGACGPTTGSISNSYGSSANKSFLCGMPITLNRCGVQANIAVANGVGTGSGGMWSENAGPIGRVRIWISRGTSWITSRPFCSPPGGHELTVPDAGTGALGNVLALNVKAGVVNTGTVFGLGTTKVDVQVPGFGRLCVGGIFLFIFKAASATAAAGTVHSFGTVPNTKALVGANLVFQAVLMAPGSLPLTNAVQVTIGQ